MYTLFQLPIGNESVPKIITNNIINLFLTAISISVISSHNYFRILFDKIASVYFIRKYIYTVLLYYWLGSRKGIRPVKN